MPSPSDHKDSASQLAAGDWVRIHDAAEILTTLDENGCVDGTPFMPEMARFCGATFRVRRIANKACVNTGSVSIGMLEGCVVLQMSERCDGSEHGGCQLGCRFFWKKQWLAPVENGTRDAQSGKGSTKLSPALVQLRDTTIRNDGSYRCQATELSRTVTPVSPFQFSQYVRDYQSGIEVRRILGGLASLVRKKLTRASDNFPGPYDGRTPVEELNLKVGDKVIVRSAEEIRQTLNGQGMNRGLWFDKAEMSPFCGREMVVSRVITRLIDERSGELKELKQPSIVLAETECSGIFRRFCSRGMLHFWRETWLRRA